MLKPEKSRSEISPEYIVGYFIYETETRQSLIDPYPYAAQGIVFGVLLSIVFWCSLFSVLLLVL